MGSGAHSASSIVDLQKDLFADRSDKCIAVRVHKAVNGSITSSSKPKNHETQILNSTGIRGRARNLKKLRAHTSGVVEWKLCGCPLRKCDDLCSLGLKLGNCTRLKYYVEFMMYV